MSSDTEMEAVPNAPNEGERLTSAGVPSPTATGQPTSGAAGSPSLAAAGSPSPAAAGLPSPGPSTASASVQEHSYWNPHPVAEAAAVPDVRVKPCAVPGCWGAKKRFRLPKQAVMRQAWIEALSLTGVDLPRDPRICAKHFKPEDVNPSTGHLLWRRVPSLFPAGSVEEVSQPADTEVGDRVLSDDERSMVEERIRQIESDIGVDDIVDVRDPAMGFDEAAPLAPVVVREGVAEAVTADVGAASGAVASQPNVAQAQLEGKVLQLLAQVKERDDIIERQTSEISELVQKGEENAALQQQLSEGVAERDKLRAEVALLKKKINTLQHKAYRARESMKKLKRSPKDAAVKSVLKNKHGLSDAELAVIFRKKELMANPRSRPVRQWSREEIAEALVDRCISSKSYKWRRSKRGKHALPGISTLRRYIRNFRCEEGLLMGSLDVLRQKLDACASAREKELTKLVVIAFDEMKLRECYSYDPREQQVRPPAKFLHLASVRGLAMPFKQPIWTGLDKPMTDETLDEIIMALEEAGFHVCLTVCNQGGKNIGFMNAKGITVDKPWFPNPFDSSRRVYMMYDVPHLMKNCRSHLLDCGYRLPSGETICKADLLKLLEENQVLRCNWKMTRAHLECSHSMRQRVDLAVQVLSRTTAGMLERTRSDKPDSVRFIRLLNDFFDVMNSRSKRDDNELKGAYGTALEAQEKVLDEMQEAIVSVRKIGAKPTAKPDGGTYVCSLSTWRERRMSGSW